MCSGEVTSIKSSNQSFQNLEAVKIVEFLKPEVCDEHDSILVYHSTTIITICNTNFVSLQMGNQNFSWY